MQANASQGQLWQAIACNGKPRSAGFQPANGNAGILPAKPIMEKRRKRNQIFCDLPDAEFEKFSDWASRLRKSNSALNKIVIQYFLDAPDEVKLEILQHEIKSLFQKK